MHLKQFHFFKRDLQKGPKCYEKMHDLGIIQKVQQYLKLVCIFWRNCLEFFSFQMNGDITLIPYLQFISIKFVEGMNKKR